MVAADLLNHPDYKYLVRHNGEPSLSLLGGPEADITPANLLKKIMAKWCKEPEESSDGNTASGFGASAGDAAIPERWEEAGGSAGGSRGAMEEGPQGEGARDSLSSDGKAAGRRRGAGGRRRRRQSSKSMKPPADAVSMANQGVYFRFACICMLGQRHPVHNTIHGYSKVCQNDAGSFES